LETDQSSSHLWWRDFCVVHWDDHGQTSDTHTCDEAAAQNAARSTSGNGGDLDDDANDLLQREADKD
jgi:hypothetical protein